MRPESLHLLLVQENPIQARLIQRLIEDAEGGTVVRTTHVSRFAEALEVLGREPVDVVLLALVLPDLSGLEAVERMIGCAPEVPIVVFTGTNDIDLAVRAVERGAQDYLVKGEANGNEIVRALCSAVERHRILAELKESRDRLAREKAELQQALRMARAMQHQLLPAEGPDVEGIELYGRLVPTSDVGGDFYDFIRGPDDEGQAPLFVCIGDVPGRGVAAPVAMVLALRAIQNVIQRGIRDTREILVEVNRILKRGTSRGMFVSLLLLRWTPKTGRICLTPAGFERPFLYRTGARELQPIETGGIVLGVMEDVAPLLQERDLELAPGDWLLLLSDGVMEARDREGRSYGPDRLREVLARIDGASAREVVEAITADVTDHAAGVTLQDDLMVVALRRTG